MQYSRNEIWGVRDVALAHECAACQPSPWTRAAGAQRLGEARRTSDMVPFSELARTDFYHDFVVPLQIDCCMGAQHLLDGGDMTVHSVYRPLRRGDFTDAEVGLFQRLTSHLRRAELLSRRLRAVDAARAAALEALQRLAFGVVLVDRRARPVFANQAAEAIFAAGEGLALQGKELRCWLDADTRALRALLQGAAGGDPPGAGGELLLQRPSGAPLAALVAPLRPEGLFPGCAAPAAVLFVLDPERPPEDGAALMRRLFGLTGAEARVACEVARGGGLREVADALKVSRNTVRTHLAHVLSKTGARRQADLTRLLLDLAGPVRPGGAGAGSPRSKGPGPRRA
jgi:DNA-binding CsgD family transcriptional regulator